MSKATRMLTMAGMALVAGATAVAGPAAASPSTAQETTSAARSTQYQVESHRGREWVEGYYRTHRQCEWAGRRGERFGRWDSYDCERVHRRFGSLWRLEVERHRSHGHGDDNNDRGHRGDDNNDNDRRNRGGNNNDNNNDDNNGRGDNNRPPR